MTKKSPASDAHDGRVAPCSVILFVAGQEANSRLARKNLARICDQESAERYDVRVVDVLEDFETAARHNILLTPTLLRIRPEPLVTLLGNLNNHAKVRGALLPEP